MIENNNLPKVSIITVCLNSENTIEKTIQSVLSQTYPNIEYIIIDGRSKDKTVDIIQKYQECIQYWCSEKDYGIYDAMNKGIIKSSGDFIAILNSDDWYEKNAIEISIREIIKNNADYSYGNVRVFDNEGDYLFTSRSIADPDLLHKKVYYEMPFPHITMVIRRQIYQKIGLFDLTFKIAADHDFVVKLHLDGSYKGIYIGQVLGNVTNGGISSCGLSVFKEFRSISIRHGKSYSQAYVYYLSKILKYYLAKFLPPKIVGVLKKLNRSRHI